MASDILKTESAHYEEKLALIQENLLAAGKDHLDGIYGCAVYLYCKNIFNREKRL